MKAKTNVVFTLAAAALLGIFGYRSLAKQIQPVAVNASNCTPAHIRSVVDATQRSVLSAQCAKAAQH